MGTVQAEYTFDRDEFLRAHRFASYISLGKSYRFLILLLGLAMVYVGVCSLIHSDPWGYVGLFLAFTMCLTLWNQSFQAKRDFKKSSNKNAHFVWNFDEEQIAIATSTSESRFGWNNVIEAVTCKEGYLLYIQRRIFYWLPRKAFASQEDFETFEKLVKEKVAVIRKV